MSRSGKVKKVLISADLLTEMLRRGSDVRESVCIYGLPKDAVIVDAKFINGENVVELQVESEQFSHGDNHEMFVCQYEAAT